MNTEDEKAQFRQRLHTALRKLQAEGPAYRHAGICGNVTPLLNSMGLPLIEELCRNWPHFSGDPRFPVPHPTLSPRLAYLVALTTREGHWTRTQDEAHNAYVQKRYELLDFLIEATK